MSNRLDPGQQLLRGEQLTEGPYRFVLQDDGNLVLYRNGTARWNSGTDGIAVEKCVMQGDGNLVLYKYDQRPAWSSGTHGNPTSYLVLQGDGNVVIYRALFPRWATNTPGELTSEPPGDHVLNPGQELPRGGALERGPYLFVLQDDGNLVLYKRGEALWHSGTHGIAIEKCIMQLDGNLVLYKYDGQAAWNSGTFRYPGSFLVLQEDGNVVIYQPDVALWATNTHE